MVEKPVEYPAEEIVVLPESQNVVTKALMVPPFASVQAVEVNSSAPMSGVVIFLTSPSISKVTPGIVVPLLSIAVFVVVSKCKFVAETNTGNKLNEAVF